MESMRKNFTFNWKLLLYFFSFTFFSITAQGANYYVDNSGSPLCSDSASYGSESKPWCTIEYAANKLLAGDNLYIKQGSGNYKESVDIIGVKGNAGNWITIKTYPGHAVLNDRSSYSSGTGFYFRNCSYIILDGIEIRESNQNLYITESDHITVQNCIIHASGQEAVHINGNSSYIVIDHNRIYDTYNYGYNGECVYIGDASDSPPDYTNYVTISNNEIYDCRDEAIEVKRASHHVTIDKNIIYNSTSAWNYDAAGMITLNHDGLYNQDPAHVIKNNIIHDHANATGGAIWTDTGCKIYNNVVWNSSRGVYVSNSTSDTWTREVYHNTLNTSGAGLTIAGGAHNIRNNIGTTDKDECPSCNIAFNATYFVNVTGGYEDYHLVSGSSPIDAGVDLINIVAVDLDGNSRPNGLRPDLGAYEYKDKIDNIAPSSPKNLKIAQ